MIEDLQPHYVEDLRRSGLNDKTITELGFDIGPILFILYPSSNGWDEFVRVKSDNKICRNAIDQVISGFRSEGGS